MLCIVSPVSPLTTFRDNCDFLTSLPIKTMLTPFALASASIRRTNRESIARRSSRRIDLSTIFVCLRSSFREEGCLFTRNNTGQRTLFSVIVCDLSIVHMTYDKNLQCFQRFSLGDTGPFPIQDGQPKDANACRWWT